MNLLVDLPVWAVSDEAKAFFFGVGVGALVRIFAVALAWFRSAGDDLPGADS